MIGTISNRDMLACNLLLQGPLRRKDIRNGSARSGTLLIVFQLSLAATAVKTSRLQS